MTNLPLFTSIKVNLIEQDLKDILAQQVQAINNITESTTTPTWDNTIAPLDKLSAQLHDFFAPISHLNNVANTKELRAAYNACLPHLSSFSTWVGHNHNLFKLIQQLQQSDEFNSLDQAQQLIINNEIRDFTLAGIDLPADKKERYANIQQQLSHASTKFEENILDCTAAWEHLITDESKLDGLPQHFIESAKNKAEQNKQTGWLLTLDTPSVIMVTQYAKNRNVRQTVYQAFCTRASEQPPHDIKYDNTNTINEILKLKLELAQLLGFNNYAEHSLATKMMSGTQEVLQFLQELIDASTEQATQETKELIEFAKNNLQIENLEAWDTAFASEQFRLQQYNISQEELRPYFPANSVIQGLFNIAQTLFNIKIEEIKTFDSWHTDVTCYQVSNQQNQVISHFYLDLYTRSEKRNGAWMDDCKNRWMDEHGIQQTPVTFITCNFQGPLNDSPALLAHDDVITLFHEFGHATQHMLTNINYLGASGLTGIPWDAVEVASQFLENYAFEQQPLTNLSCHYETNAKLPTNLYEKMIKARHFQSAISMMRQLQFALFDFKLHIEFNPKQEQQVQQLLNDVRAITSTLPTPEYNRFQNSFSHIFAGGYAAGYYSYKWAEVMAADIFSIFKENGIFNKETAKRYSDTFLALGGAYDPSEVFMKMCGRAPDTSALLMQSGITPKTNKI